MSIVQNLDPDSTATPIHRVGAYFVASNITEIVEKIYDFRNHREMLFKNIDKNPPYCVIYNLEPGWRNIPTEISWHVYNPEIQDFDFCEKPVNPVYHNRLFW